VSEGAPSACPGLFPRGLARPGGGYRRGRRAGFRRCRGRRGMRVVRGARSAPSGGRKGPEGGAGETGGNPGLWGGCPGCPPRCLQASTSGRHRAVCAIRGARRIQPRPARTLSAAHRPLSSVMGATGSLVVFWGRQEWGSGGITWNRAVILRGRGGSGFSHSAFPDWSPLLSVYSCSRAVVFPTSLSCLVEGVRSGTRRRRGASASAQAGGGIGPESRRTAPARAGAVLYGRCAAVAWGVRGWPVRVL
jgi:hypothetical protein